MKFYTLSILVSFVFFMACNTPSNNDTNNAQTSEESHKSHDHESHGHKEHKEEGGHHGKHHTDHNKSNVLMNENDFSDLVEGFEDPSRAEWQNPDLVISKFENLKGKKVGDIGSGTGYFSFRIAEKGANVVAIDVDKRFLNFIDDRVSKKDIKNVTTRFVEYEDPKLIDEEFDALIIVNTYHHFNDKNAYLKKCLAGLKKGGKLMIVDFKKEEVPFGPPVDHKIHESEVKSDLEKAGFKVVEVDSKSLNYQYVVIGER